MKLIRPTSEADMIAVYLKAEIRSQRFGQIILDLLAQDVQPRAIIEAANKDDPTENAYRRRLLGAYRAYVFEEIPAQTNWHRALLNREEVAQVRYIDYDYWNELSAHTRLPGQAAETIRAGREIFGVSNAGFLQAAQALREGAHFPELILVAASPTSVLTVYEGHLRLTAYVLVPECIPPELEVIVGFAPECAQI